MYQTTALTQDHIRKFAPSVFAERPYEQTSEKYQFIPTSKIVSALEREGFGVFRAQESRTRNEAKQGFTKHMLRLRRNEDMGAPKGGCVPEIIITNSHDGSGSYKVQSGIFEIACMNGLVVAREKMSDIRVRHQGDIVGRVIEGVYEVVDDFERVMSVREDWQGLMLDREERRAFAESAHGLKWDAEVEEHVAGLSFNNEGDVVIQQERMKFDPTKLLAVKREADNNDSLWSTFNRVQENIIRGGIHYVSVDANGRPRANTTRPVKAVGEDMRLNLALWKLAEAMAQHKHAA